MSNEHAGGGRPSFNYFVDGEKYEWSSASITGKQIKEQIPSFNPAFQLFLEAHGQDPDRLIGDADVVSLDHGAPHLYTAPPATFGAESA